MENDGNPQSLIPRGLRYFSEFLIMIALVILGGNVLYAMSISLFGPMFDINTESLGKLLTSGNATRNQLNGLKIIQALYTIGSFLIPALFIPRMFKEKRSEYLQLNNYARWYHYLLGILILLCSSPFNSYLYELNNTISLTGSLGTTLRKMEDQAAMMSKMLLEVNSGWDMFWNVLLIGMLPALGEELMFRGAMQKFFYNWTSNVHVAVIVSAIIFSAVHAQFYGLIPRAVMGVLLGYMVVYSGSIWVAIVAHAFNNTSILVINNLEQRHMLPEVLSEHYQLPDYIGWISLVLTLLLVLLLRRIQPRIAGTETI